MHQRCKNQVDVNLKYVKPKIAKVVHVTIVGLKSVVVLHELRSCTNAVEKISNQSVQSKIAVIAIISPMIAVTCFIKSIFHNNHHELRSCT